MIERVPVIGPRDLPTGGYVKVWIDGGSGPGYDIEVRPEHLALSQDDDGEGQAAVYELKTFFCGG